VIAFFFFFSLALHPRLGFSLLHNTSPQNNTTFRGSSEGFVTIILFWCGVVSPTPNPQPGGPEDLILSFLYPREVALTMAIEASLPMSLYLFPQWQGGPAIPPRSGYPF